MNTLIPVVIESPYAGNVVRNTAYARACMHDCLRRGEAGLAPHLLYTQPGVLDDTIPEERSLGIDAGFAWGQLAKRIVVYTDLGISPGMAAGVEYAQARGAEVVYRTLGPVAAKQLPLGTRSLPVMGRID